MLGLIKKSAILSCLILLMGLFFVSKANAASLANVSDTVTTSRPSPSATSAANIASGDGQVIIADDGTTFLASDSATVYPDLGESLAVGIKVSSMSGSGIPWTGARTVYLANTFSNSHHKGNAFLTNITAMHTIRLTPSANIPTGGHIVLTFPTVTNNVASPSATGFSFNGLATGNMSSNIKCNPSTACGGGSQTISGNTITLTTTAQQNGGSAIIVSIGCTGTVDSAGVCSAPSPLLINPTVSSTQCTTPGSCTSGPTNDAWKVNIQTTDASSSPLDQAKAFIGTIQSVQVQGTVEPSMTFSITGVADGATACSDTTNAGSGFSATATFVNLGTLASNKISIAAQILQVDTNSSYGYTITATSSGRFINPGTGYWLADANGGNGLLGNDGTNGTNPVPVAITVGTPAFGIHPCQGTGSVSTPTIPTGWGTGGGSNNKYANPWNSGTNSYYATIASFGSPAQTSRTAVEYAATVGSTTPAGTYGNYVTYVATPSF